MLSKKSESRPGPAASEDLAKSKSAARPDRDRTHRAVA
jgi:hypothetical protein